MIITSQPGYPVANFIRGRMGYAYIFKMVNFKQIIMQYYYPYDPRAPAVLANRHKFAYGVFYWQGFNDATKQFYNSLKYPNVMSGYNRYLSYYLSI
jgi:hypothetical protein